MSNWLVNRETNDGRFVVRVDGSIAVAVVFCPSRPSLAAPLSISNSFGLFANEVQSPEETCQNQASATDDTVAAGKVEGRMEEALQDVQ